MSTTNFESDSKRIEAPQRSVFEKLSNADNLEKLKERIPADKLDNISLDNGMLTFKTPMGAVSMQIKDTEPFHSVTYGTVESPIPFDIRMELVPLESHSGSFGTSTLLSHNHQITYETLGENHTN